jgi:hypothetical protein
VPNGTVSIAKCMILWKFKPHETRPEGARFFA